MVFYLLCETIAPIPVDEKPVASPTTAFAVPTADVLIPTLLRTRFTFEVIGL